MTRREYIMTRTAETRSKYQSAQDALSALRAEESEIDYPCARLVRLSDRIWDLSARLNMISDQILREGAAAAAEFDNKRAA